MNDVSATRKMIEIVDELYIRQAGPFGTIVCSDALDEWEAQYPKMHFVNLPDYIDVLANELPDRKTKVEFINSLRAIEVIATQSTIKAYLEKY